MAMLFIAGFDECNNPVTSFDGVGASNQGHNDLTGTLSRTGSGCYVSQGAFGPFKGVGNKTDLIVGVAVKPLNLPGGEIFNCWSGGVTGVIQISVVMNSDGSLSVVNRNLPFQATLGKTAQGIVFSNVYAYVELQVHVDAIAGSFTLRVNGATVLTGSTLNTNPAATSFIDTVQIRGPGGGLTSVFDDFYIFDTTGGVNNSLAGAVRVYTALPTSDSSPLQWAPSTGSTHFNLVNGVPAESQVTYVSDATPGNTDQYLYNVSAIPASVQILGVQHGLDAFLDTSGSGSIGSSCGGIVAGSVGLSTSAHIYPFPRDTDPVAAGPWTLANLTTRPFGPNRTA